MRRIQGYLGYSVIYSVAIYLQKGLFWLRLCHAVILISNIQISASMRINWMALIELMVLTGAFERTDEKFCGIRQPKWRRLFKLNRPDQ